MSVRFRFVVMFDSIVRNRFRSEGQKYRTRAGKTTLSLRSSAILTGWIILASDSPTRDKRDGVVSRSVFRGESLLPAGVGGALAVELPAVLVMGRLASAAVDARVGGDLTAADL